LPILLPFIIFIC